MRLKEFYARYSRLAFGLGEGDAYELQRVLQTTPAFPRGRPGPGGSAPATPFAVVAFVIAVMAGGARQRAVEQMFRYHDLLQEGAVLSGWGDGFKATFKLCPLTGERAFGHALARIFEAPSLAKRVETITIVRDWPEAVIEYLDAGTQRQSRFVAERSAGRVQVKGLPGALITKTTLGGAIVHQIALDLADDHADNHEGDDS